MDNWFSFELNVNTSQFNVIRLVMMTILIASLSQFLLDWVISETRIRALASGKDVDLSGTTIRFFRSSGSVSRHRWLHLILVFAIYAAEILIEFGSGSTTYIVPIRNSTSVLQNVTPFEPTKCKADFKENSRPCFRYNKLTRIVSECTELNGKEYKARTTYLQPLKEDPERYTAICPLSANSDFTAKYFNLLVPTEYNEVARLTHGVYFPRNHSIKEVNDLEMSVKSAFIADASNITDVPGPQMFALDAVVNTTNAPVRIYCDPFCVTDSGPSCVESPQSFLRRCFMISKKSHKMILTGHVDVGFSDERKQWVRQVVLGRNLKTNLFNKTIDPSVNFRQDEFIGTSNIPYNQYFHMFAHISPLYWGKDAIQPVNEGVLRFLVFMARNGKYDTPSTTRMIPVDTMTVERATAGPLLLAGVAVYAAVLVLSMRVWTGSKV